VAYKDRDEVRLMSRNGRDLTQRFPALLAAELLPGRRGAVEGTGCRPTRPASAREGGATLERLPRRARRLVLKSRQRRAKQVVVVILPQHPPLELDAGLAGPNSLARRPGLPTLRPSQRRLASGHDTRDVPSADGQARSTPIRPNGWAVHRRGRQASRSWGPPRFDAGDFAPRRRGLDVRSTSTLRELPTAAAPTLLQPTANARVPAFSFGGACSRLTKQPAHQHRRGSDHQDDDQQEPSFPCPRLRSALEPEYGADGPQDERQNDTEHHRVVGPPSRSRCSADADDRPHSDRPA
jgi:hypothetical protein